MTADDHREKLRGQVLDLESRLQDAKEQLGELHKDTAPRPTDGPGNPPNDDLHTLLLLSDSALPLGSFAFSSGLESFIAHRRHQHLRTSPLTSFRHFLRLSLTSTASTLLPYVLAAHRSPNALNSLVASLDASLLCPVARRASTAQGKALVSLWERSFTATVGSSSGGTSHPLHIFRPPPAPPLTQEPPPAHFAPIWGSLTASMDLSAHQSAYVFLLNHAKAVLSAAVRASIMGPYQAQSILMEPSFPAEINTMINRQWHVPVEDAAQVAPMLDLWMGRHELLYSRIFNS